MAMGRWRGVGTRNQGHVGGHFKQKWGWIKLFFSENQKQNEVEGDLNVKGKNLIVQGESCGLSGYKQSCV